MKPQACLRDYVPCPPPAQSVQELKDLEDEVAEKSRKKAGQKVTRTTDVRAEEWRARGLERILGPCPDKHELVLRMRRHFLQEDVDSLLLIRVREFEEACDREEFEEEEKRSWGPAC
jgi:hypothetical protein